MTSVICKNPITLKMNRRSQHRDAAVIETSTRTKASDRNKERIIQERAHAKIIPLGKRTKTRTHIIVARDTVAEADLR